MREQVDRYFELLPLLAIALIFAFAERREQQLPVFTTFDPMPRISVSPLVIFR